MPCWISVYEEGGRTKLATITPTAMIVLYPNPEMRGVAGEVERPLEAIMAAAARQGGWREAGGRAIRLPWRRLMYNPMLI